MPNYVPQLGAQLYTTNGETDGHMENTFGTLTQTPEMSTCETASASDPDDEWEPEDCGSGFEFPDDEALIAQEVENNFPYAIAVAKSAQDPDDPVSPVGRTVPDFDPDEFDDLLRRQPGGRRRHPPLARRKQMHYSINDGAARTRPCQRVDGRRALRRRERPLLRRVPRHGHGPAARRRGRGLVLRRQARRAGRVTSERFSYEVRDDEERGVLVLAEEDYTGINPTYPAGTNAPRYAQEYVDALAANGVRAVVWDVDKDGVPHDLGVLKHFDAVVW